MRHRKEFPRTVPVDVIGVSLFTGVERELRKIEPADTPV
jgi:hypothetical protein